MSRHPCLAALVAAALLSVASGSGLVAQDAGTSVAPAQDGFRGAAGSRRVSGCCADTTVPVLDATRLAGAIEIDGRMDEPAWLTAPVAVDFMQFQPDAGHAATERTEARVLYGADALYVYIHAFDSRPDSVAGQLTRRDQDSYSDLVGVVIDSYFDRRTAFHFAVNPVGVKHDIYRFDDTEEDSGWDAVWDVEARRTDDGWAAEFRIPYSQLRFRDQPVQTWGINFVRDIARRNEKVLWAPTTREDGGVVSRFGELRGLEGLEAPNRLEVVPYTLARMERAPGNPSDPFYSRYETGGAVGADLKYGVTGDLTLDVTLNPDFGQVEADPAQVNLSAFETFLPERRPFFLEGSSIFNFGISLGDGDGGGESLFYSRRIGRTPQGVVDPGDGWMERADRTTILGAWKLSGKTASGWSIGALHAVTAQERATLQPLAGDRFEAPIEPLSNYGVLRLQKDFREGRSALGVIGTLARRDASVADALGLRTSAVTGGLDARHRFADDGYQISGYLLGSRVAGSMESIEATQRSPLRYYQRPDADHVELDATRTSLTGASGFASIQKIAGEHWRFSTGVHTRTPGFEVNDLGYQRDADSFASWFWVQYQQNSPQGPFRNWNVNLNGFSGWNFDGDRAGTSGNVNSNVEFRNFWYAYAGMNRSLGGYSGQALRGGPLFLSERNLNGWAGMGTDSRKAVRGNLGLWGNRRAESDSWNFGASPSVRVRPSGRATFSVGGSLSRNVDDRQWVGLFETDAPRYLFARIDQTTLGLTLRADYAFTPTLSLQLYAQPFVSAGRYDEYKRVANPVAEDYTERFREIDSRIVDGTVYLDVDGDGREESLGTPDFNVRQFRSNAVLRWEYLPGSALFVVWSQGRDQSFQEGDFDFRGNVRDLFGAPAEDVFMVKLTYWLSR